MNRKQLAGLSSVLGVLGLGLLFSHFVFVALVAGIAAILLGTYGVKSEMRGFGILGIVCGALVVLLVAVGVVVLLVEMQHYEYKLGGLPRAQ